MSLEEVNSKISNNTRSSKYLLTINNPIEHGFTHEKIIETLNILGPVYYCLADEKGLEEETPHTHIYMVFRNARSFNTIKKAFPEAHIDQCYGKHQECIDYVFKEGDWLEKEKGTTNLRDSHYEFGKRPANNQGERVDLKTIQSLIQDGFGVSEILEEYPQFLFRIKEIERAIEYHKRSLKTGFRHLDVTYISGDTATGKTRYVMDKYKDDVFRIIGYKNPFDGYNYEKVLLFDEFRDDLPLKDMLKYLDGYRMRLPIRYEDKEAMYEKVYIISNRRFEDQYIEEQYKEPESYAAFVRRINRFMIFNDKYHKFVFENYKDYMARLCITLEEFESKEVKNEETQLEREIQTGSTGDTDD